MGLTLVNGRAGDTDDASGGCMFMGEDADAHLGNITFQNCSAPGVCTGCGKRESGRDNERDKERERRREGVRERERARDFMCFTLSERCLLFLFGPH